MQRQGTGPVDKSPRATRPLCHILFVTRAVVAVHVGENNRHRCYEFERIIYVEHRSVRTGQVGWITAGVRGSCCGIRAESLRWAACRPCNPHLGHRSRPPGPSLRPAFHGKVYIGTIYTGLYTPRMTRLQCMGRSTVRLVF